MVQDGICTTYDLLDDTVHCVTTIALASVLHQSNDIIAHSILRDFGGEITGMWLVRAQNILLSTKI